MRGAAMLPGLDSCAVVDVGGTTTDVGILTNGFPREANTEVQIGGVRTNFRMPDVLSVGLGGGSLVTERDGVVQIGPRSVGYRLREESLVFGGSALTATDIVVAAGMADIGDRAAVAHLPKELVERACMEIAADVADALDRMRTSAEPLAVVAVGGGSVVLSESLPGFATIVKPENFAVANAIGAAIAQVGGEVDQVFSVPAGKRESVVEGAQQAAIGRAVAAGAAPGSVRIVEFDEVPIPYLPGNATRIRCKAVGDLNRVSA